MYEQSNTSAGGNPFTSAANNALWSLQGRNSSSPSGPLSSSPAAIPQNIFTNPAIQPSSVINLSNSTDVVIGPMTQYQGPVTIYQYMDATVEARSMQANGEINQTTNTTQTSIIERLRSVSTSTYAKLLLLVLVAAGIVTAAVIYVIQSHKSEFRQGNKDSIYFGNNYEHGTFPNLGNGHLVIDRAHWGASDIGKPLTVPLGHPIPYVLVTHVGANSAPCDNIRKCSTKMRTLQDAAISEYQLPDINANFYVGDDGNIYVGRGWDWANTNANNTLAIAFMGDYNHNKPSEKQLDATQYLLSYALSEKYLKPDYHLVAQNQTKNTDSPGKHVYEVIKKWPRFHKCGEVGQQKCGAELGMPVIWDAQQ